MSSIFSTRKHAPKLFLLSGVGASEIVYASLGAGCLFILRERIMVESNVVNGTVRKFISFSIHFNAVF